MAALAAYLRSLPSKWQTELQEPANVKKMIRILHRRFAVTLNLNDGFEGGELWFQEFGPRRYRPPPGGAAVFSCSLLHEARPVTAGRHPRAAAVAFRAPAPPPRCPARRGAAAGR